MTAEVGQKKRARCIKRRDWIEFHHWFYCQASIRDRTPIGVSIYFSCFYLLSGSFVLEVWKIIFDNTDCKVQQNGRFATFSCLTEYFRCFLNHYKKTVAVGHIICDASATQHLFWRVAWVRDSKDSDTFFRTVIVYWKCLLRCNKYMFLHVI